MKLTKRGKIVFGSLFTAIFVASGIVVLPPALSPTQAEAQIMQKQYQKQYQERALAKYENADRLTKTELVDLLHAVGFKGEALRHAWAIVMKNLVATLSPIMATEIQETTHSGCFRSTWLIH